MRVFQGPTAHYTHSFRTNWVLSIAFRSLLLLKSTSTTLRGFGPYLNQTSSNHTYLINDVSVNVGCEWGYCYVYRYSTLLCEVYVLQEHKKMWVRFVIVCYTTVLLYIQVVCISLCFWMYVWVFAFAWVYSCLCVYEREWVSICMWVYMFVTSGNITDDVSRCQRYGRNHQTGSDSDS